MEINTKQELVDKLNSYASTPDDAVIRCKEKIKNALLENIKLLFSLHNVKLEKEMFNENGNIDSSGEIDQYFGYTIRPYLFIPETQTNAENFLCYTVSFDTMPKYNKLEYYMEVIFTILVDQKDIIDESTGLSRHDLIASILREDFNWSNIFGTQCNLIENKESVTDTNYIVRTLTFRCTSLNGILNTSNNKTSVINNVVRR